MQSSNLETWKKFDRLYFHAKSKIKSTKYHKIKFDTSLKSYGHAEYKILDWEQNLGLKAKNTIKSSVKHH